MLCDNSCNWRPERYRSELWGCETLLRFPTVKLIDYDVRWHELESSRNPFAVMVMAHLKTRATRKDVLELFRFIDWLLVLPDGLGRRFQDRLIEYEATMSRPYVTSIERSGIEKGLDRGLMAERALLLRQTSRRFGEACARRLDLLLAAADAPEQLVEVGEWIIDCDTGEALLARVREWTGGRERGDK